MLVQKKLQSSQFISGNKNEGGVDEERRVRERRKGEKEGVYTSQVYNHACEHILNNQDVLLQLLWHICRYTNGTRSRERI